MSFKTLIVNRDLQRAKDYARNLHGKKAEQVCVIVETHQQGLLELENNPSIDLVCITGTKYSRADAIKILSGQLQAA